MSSTNRNALICAFAVFCVSILVAGSILAVVDNGQTSDSRNIVNDASFGADEGNDADAGIASEMQAIEDTDEYIAYLGYLMETYPSLDTEENRLYLDNLILSQALGDDEVIGEKEMSDDATPSNGTKFWYNRIQYETTSGTTCKVVDYKGDYREIVIPDTAFRGDQGYTVTEISDWGLSTRSPFGRLPKTVEIGPAVEVLGKHAVSNDLAICVNTEKFVIRDVEHSKLREIKDLAFHQCWKLKEITIPTQIQIDTEAFLNCKNLEKVNFVGDGKTHVGVSAFRECYKAKIDTSKMWLIDNNAFKHCKEIREVDLSSAEIINYNAFDCPNVKKIKFGNNLKTLSNEAFPISLIGSGFYKNPSDFWSMKVNADNMRGHIFERQGSSFVMVA